MKIADKAAAMKAVAPLMANSSHEARNAALEAISASLSESAPAIYAANEDDLSAGKKNKLSAPLLARTRFDSHKMADCLAGIKKLTELEDPLGRVQLDRMLDTGLELVRKSCPIGVIGVIFEARPDALIQIAALCIKSGNCAILKGGKESAETNRALFSSIHRALKKTELPDACLFQAELHSQVNEILNCDDFIDLLIPRGSNAFVRFITQNTKIPVMGHSSGICHIYVDAHCDIDAALPVIVDAKTQYPAACNAAETLLIHADIADAFLPRLKKTCAHENITLRACGSLAKTLGAKPMTADEFDTEYGDTLYSVKLVKDIEAAVEHINHFGSHHTDCILTSDAQAARYFMNMVDSAGVYWNCSTRFADGFRYGFGAELGISTGKIGARGPVGLEGLTSYKYYLLGHGQIVADYACGKKHFHFKDKN